jgi:hypothetical protein
MRNLILINEVFIFSSFQQIANYIISKVESAQKSKSELITLLNLIEILPVGKTTVKKSLFSEFKDFEDGLQNFCAEEARIGTIITRNIKDYSKSELVVQTPKDFLAEFEMPNS